MAADLRHILAAFLTIAMFAMLGNMIKRDHFDAFQVSVQVQSNTHVMKYKRKGSIALLSKGPWQKDSMPLKECWIKPIPIVEEAKQSNGFIVFSLTNGPEYHMSQVMDAVVIARFLGATLIVPDIRGSEPGQKKKLQDMYDEEKFMRSLHGVIKIAKELPHEMTSKSPVVVSVPNQASEDYIERNIEPIFQTTGYLRLATDFSSIHMKPREKQNSDFDSTSCLAMFGSLELKQEIQEVVKTMIERLRTLDQTSNGRFLAVDLRVDILEKKICKRSESIRRKTCYSAQEVADFLKKMGFAGNTTIYLTQTWWHESLKFFKEMFPNTYTKDDLIPTEKKGHFFGPENVMLERALDFSICSQGDAFVPAITGLFYGDVIGKRIVLGRTQTLVPSSPSPDHLSTYVVKKSHLAYSCYC
ncbi:hypothetical protein HPP92_015802 [Vanilla planifolia]|uniref:O-fucosyltransferase family protein n=3 Tax=Vanilla planifolia TaxID=51239 RepID=A0A835QIK0_VANPL|nr:hypothetical protein HPP92_015802 [Vanilla planifolia]